MLTKETEEIMLQRAQKKKSNPAFTLLSGVAPTQYPSESPW